MDFPDAISSVLSKYATFTGRARRSEYWWFYLFTVLVSIATSVVDAAVGAAVGNDWNAISLVASLALLLPSLAVGVRRLHDTGRTGWWLLLPMVPALAALVCFVGFIASVVGDAFDGTVTESSSQGFAGLLIVLVFGFALLALTGAVTLVVFLCLDSTPGPNKYGASPKYPAPPAAPGGFYPPAGYGQPSPYPQQRHPQQGYPPQP